MNKTQQFGFGSVTEDLIAIDDHQKSANFKQITIENFDSPKPAPQTTRNNQGQFIAMN